MKASLLNVAEMRLYYCPEARVVEVLPIGINQLGTDPGRLGDQRAAQARRARPGPRPRRCTPGYAAVARPCLLSGPAGPDNPWGCSRSTSADVRHPRYQRPVRHRPAGEPRLRASAQRRHRCLFKQVPVGTRVQFVNQPSKASCRAGWPPASWKCTSPLAQPGGVQLQPATAPAAHVHRRPASSPTRTARLCWSNWALEQRSGMPIAINRRSAVGIPEPRPLSGLLWRGRNHQVKPWQVGIKSGLIAIEWLLGWVLNVSMCFYLFKSLWSGDLR